MKAFTHSISSCIFRTALFLGLAVLGTGCGRTAGEFTASELELIGSDAGEVMRVLKSDNPEDLAVLRDTALPVPRRMSGSTELNILCQRMLVTVNDPENEGVGIAAPQVGISRRIVEVMRYDKEGKPWEIFINPEIVRYGGSFEPGPEGCLSVPDLRGTVDRAQEIDISYRTPEGRKVTETISGYTAVICQHEIDHLDGILYTDKATLLQAAE